MICPRRLLRWPSMSDVLVDIQRVSKHFGGVRALREVSLAIAPGEVHALCGENGAGKSTLIEILSGSCRPNAGQVLLAGRRLGLGNVGACEQAGVAVIHQEPVAFGHLSAVDNIFVGRELTLAGGLLLNRRAMRRGASELLADLGGGVDLACPVRCLPPAQRQRVAMARAILRDAKLLILDEPTASLSERETAVLFALIRRLRNQGVSVLYVSHRLEEVFALADRVSVLRDGRLVGTRLAGELDRATLIAMMVGPEASESSRLGGDGPAPGKAGEALLEVSGLTRRGAFEDITFTVRAGEVVGLAGLVGAGRSDVARALGGVDEPDGGLVKLAGEILPGGSVRRAIAGGLVLVPEDRHRQGLVLPMSVGANLTLSVLRRLTRMGLTRPARERRMAGRIMGELDIRAESDRAAVSTLSGGNQQKVVLGKALAAKPKVLVLDEPTRGVDVAAKAQLHRQIRLLADRGMATLLISSDLPELLSASDRVVVMRAGRITGELTRDEATQERVLHLALPPDRANTEGGAS